MVFSTNQVLQFYNLTPKGATAPSVAITSAGKGTYISLTVDGKTSVTPSFNKVLSVQSAAAADDVKYRKVYKIAVTTAQAGESYVLTLTYRDVVGEEDSYEKFASYIAKTGDDANAIVKGLAKSLIDNRGVENKPLYDVYNSAGTLVDASNVASMSGTYFYIVEPIPDWELGSFPETLENMAVEGNIIQDSNGVDVSWATITKYTAADSAVSSLAIAPIYNVHTIADLEYFCTGEKGNSSWQAGWPMNIKPASTVLDTDAGYGYHVCVAHVANVGNNQNSTLQEFDIVFVAACGADGDKPSDFTITLNETANKKLTDFVAALTALIG